MAGQLTELIIS